MTIENTTTNSCAARVEHRRSERYHVSVPAEVKWHGPGGVNMKEKAHAEEVNAHGGLLRMNTYPSVGAVVELSNVVSAESVEGRVLAMRGSRADMGQGIVIELCVPNETFWGVNFQLMKTEAGLAKLGQSLRPDGIDVRVLKEFRPEADSIPRSAWAIQESKHHSQRRGPAEAPSLLSFVRSEETGIREQGRSPRVEPPKGVWVAWQGSDQRFFSRLFDLSMGGVFIPTANLPRVGTAIRLTFELPDGEVYVLAVVRHTVVGWGMDVEFAAAEDGDLVRILQLLTEPVH
jgi:PilZ domain